MPKVCPVCGTSYADSNVFCPADGSTLRAADPDGDLIGSVVADRYLVTDLLGEGGMGKVYLARHVRLPQQAAIKVLRPEMLKDPAAIARFNREAANACRIEHERVARVFDFGETSDGLVYLAMEYVAGSSLKDILQKEGPLSLARTAAIVRQIGDGLDAAHRLGIVHRDLKPDNILVTKDEADGSDRCKVVDFGIAKAMGGNEKEAGLTKTGFVVGTPEFMSPEQLLGTELDQRSDVYALALVAYTCLTCDLPFDSNTPDRGMTARLMSAPRTLQTVRPDLNWPRQLQVVFDAALQKEAAKRTPTAGTFARAFEAAIQAPVVTPATPAAAVAPALDPTTPGAARVISAFDKPVTGNKPKPSKPKPTPPPRKSVKTPAVAAPVDDDEPSPRRSFRFPRLPLPSLGLVLVVAGGWWFYKKQRAPRPSDLNALVNSASRSAERVISGAADAASSAGDAVRSSTSSSPSPAPAGTAPGTPATTTGTGAPPAAPAPAAANTPTTATGGALSPAAQSARKTLDSITNTLDPTESDEGAARSAIPVLRSIMARLPSGTDSTWAYIRIAEAHLVLGEQTPACGALRSAKATARTMNQAEAINRYTGMLGCGQ